MSTYGEDRPPPSHQRQNPAACCKDSLPKRRNLQFDRSTQLVHRECVMEGTEKAVS